VSTRLEIACLQRENTVSSPFYVGLCSPDSVPAGTFQTVSRSMEFSEVRLTVYYCGTTATASISTKKSGCARPETNAIVMAGGLGTSGQAFWNAAKPASSGCPSTT
jgi:hypothetical protein